MQNQVPKKDYLMSEFLETSPPNNWVKILNLKAESLLETPTLQLHCDNCNGVRNFNTQDSAYLTYSYIEKTYLTYKCSNCKEQTKIYSLLILPKEGMIYKLGEYPTFGPPTPAKLINLLGAERETFLKGRRCENQGLGIAAFAYYRRVVENQKDKIIGEIIRVSKKLNVSDVQLEKLNSALSENQFTNAINLAKDSLPESLLINGQNPLLLLYRALSEGVHNLSDEKCLELAQDIRIVLGALADRLSQALKDDAELINAISRLTKINS